MDQNNDLDNFLKDLDSFLEDTAVKENKENLSDSNSFSFDSVFEDFFNDSAEKNNDISVSEKSSELLFKADYEKKVTPVAESEEKSVSSARTDAAGQITDPRFEAYLKAQDEDKREMLERRKSALNRSKGKKINLNDSAENSNSVAVSSNYVHEAEQATEKDNQPTTETMGKKQKRSGLKVRKKEKNKAEPEQADSATASEYAQPAEVQGIPMQYQEQNDIPIDQQNSENATEQVENRPDVMTDGKKRVPLVLRILLLLIEVIVIIALALYSVMFVLAKGPSDTAKRLFVKSVRETSAIGFLANIYLTDEEIADIESSGISEQAISMDTSLIKINAADQKDDGGADAWGFVDEDGDGIVIEEVHGNTFNGYMMIVYDPSRVIMGCDPNSFGVVGYTVEQMVKKFDAVAGINGGGFVDLNGTGNGETPSTVTVFKGQRYYSNSSSISGFAGIGSDHILHVDISSPDDLEKYDIQYGCGYGPVLVVNGEIHIGESWESGLNPRTVIGQRSDGAMLLLVIDGRHVASLGASFEDVAEVMMDFGAVNACNMDGGSSSLMYYQTDYVNNKAFVIGVRPVPTTWLVLKEGAQDEYYN